MKKLPPKPIAIDFDGTVVTHDFPEVGKDIGAVPVLKRLVEAGHKLILYTMRSGATLDAAKKWFEANDIDLAGVQYAPGQTMWTASNKCYAALYIDDAALGAPLKHNLQIHDRPFINWKVAETKLETLGFLERT